MKASAFVELFGRERASAILRCDDEALAADAMEAAVRGGFTILEFTLSVPGVFDLLRRFSARPGLVVGAGTVLTPDEVERCLSAGARFLVSPVVDREVIAAAVAADVAMMPGTHTPTEMLAAYRAGAPLQKLFPAPGLGPAYVKACLGPLPFLRLVPTNGTDAGNARDWLAAGAFALGFTTGLFDPTDLAARRFDAITARARAIRSAISG